MLIGLAIYVAGWKYLPPDRHHAVQDIVSEPLSRADWRAVAAVVVMLVPVLFVITAADQAYNLVIVWAETHVDRGVGGLTMPVTWFLTIDGLMTIVGILITFPV